MSAKDYPRLLPGDIVGVKGKGLLLWLSQHLLEPHTDRVHFFIIGDYIPWDEDYVILESIGKGIAVGRLSFYKPEDLEIYRVNLSRDPRLRKVDALLRRQAAAALTLVGRSSYDYLLYFHLVMGALNLILHGKLPPYDPAQLPYGRNRAYICTEAANFGWRHVGHPVIPKGVVPTPAGYERALIRGEIRRIFPSIK
jgi:hypothetical protein